MQEICFTSQASQRSQRLSVKHVNFLTKNVQSDGVFDGYASLFNIADLGRDVVLRGAFAQSLAQQPACRIKMLWQHKSSEPIGVWLSVVEDNVGLKVQGQLNLALRRGQEAHSRLKKRSIDGLSIGYIAEKTAQDPSSGLRYLQQIRLMEISVVTFPMLPQARIGEVKKLTIQNIGVSHE